VAAKRGPGKPAAPAYRLGCIFFRTEAGAEPVRQWLKDQIPAEARKTIGADIKTVQQTWPIGKPLVDGLGDGLWEVRSAYSKVDYRTIFTIDGSTMVLLHGCEKHSKKTRQADLDLARRRKAQMEQRQ
jgi:phage-related protein